MARKVAFITNAKEYAGPPAVSALAKAGWDVFCTDDSFSSSAARQGFEHDNPGGYAASGTEMAGFIAECLARFGRIDALVSNDIPKGIKPINTSSLGGPSTETDGLNDFEAYQDSLITTPVRTLRAVLPIMKQARSGSIVLITSGAPLRVPAIELPHGYTVGRAAAHALVKSLAGELAPHNIQVNAVAPFFVYNETFFPSELGAEDQKYQPALNHMVPMRRFGAPAELGSLIAQLASGEVSFVSGQIVAFSGAGC